MARPLSLEDASEDALRTPGDITLSGVTPSVGRPIILDPRDNLPREDDENVSIDAIPSETDENFICTEAGDWRPWTHGGYTDQAAVLPSGFDESRLVLHSFSALPDDRRRIFVDPESGELYARQRPPCKHYSEALAAPEELDRSGLEGHESGLDVADGQPTSLLRMCSHFKLDLTDGALFACDARFPRDLVSEAHLVARVRLKRAQAKLAPTRIFRDPTPAEKAKNADAPPAESNVEPGLFTMPSSPEGAVCEGVLFVHPPSAHPDEILRTSPQYVFFPDATWQPNLSDYSERPYKDIHGGEQVFMASMSGENILRFKRKPGADLDAVGRFDRQSLAATVREIALTLTRGRNVVIVPYDRTTGQAMVERVQAAVTHAYAHPATLPEELTRK
jgi:hypothetical protein